MSIQPITAVGAGRGFPFLLLRDTKDAKQRCELSVDNMTPWQQRAGREWASRRGRGGGGGRRFQNGDTFWGEAVWVGEKFETSLRCY